MDSIQNQQDLLQQVEAFLNQSSDEERQVLQSILDGLQKRQAGEYNTYLAGITHLESRFIDEDTYELTIPIQPLIENPLKMIHGGITATLLDTGMGSLIIRSLPEGYTAVTSEIKVNYISPGVGSTLRCQANIAHKGKHLWVAEAKVYSDKGKLVALANGSFFIIPTT